jgi:hypothetical protein
MWFRKHLLVGYYEYFEYASFAEYLKPICISDMLSKEIEINILVTGEVSLKIAKTPLTLSINEEFIEIKNNLIIKLL